MFEYTIRRLLLMIPTGLGITFMVFCILQLAPDGPFERAVKQIKQANMGAGEVSMASSDVSGDSSELTPELLEKLRMQYGLDKPIVVRYLIWLGFYPKEAKSKTIPINKSFRESVDILKFDTYKEYLLQKYVKVVKDDKGKLLVIETGVGLEFDVPEIQTPELRENFNSEKYYAFINNYQELPSNENIIKTWYHSDWEIKKIDEEKNIVTLVKKQFKGILQGYLGYSEKKGKDVILDRRFSAIISVMLFIGLPFYLGHESKNPVYFGMYSPKYMLVNIVYVLTLIASIGLFIYRSRKKT